MTESHHPATTVGETAGLPGTNADPRTRTVPEDEQAGTTAATGDRDADAAAAGAPASGGAA